MIIVLDTETTGLPANYNAPPSDSDAWPRVTQLCWALFDEMGQQVKRVSKLILPDGWVIPKEQFFIKNGHSTERSLAEGVPLRAVLEELIQDRKASHYVVAHNLSFDSKILRAEMFRAGLGEIEFTGKKVCTMMKSTSYCAIPKANGNGIKWPTLVELHNHLFKCDFEGAHDAGGDVDACAKCLFELIRLKVIVLD